VIWEKFNVRPKPGLLKTFFTTYIWSLLLLGGQGVAMFIAKQRIEGVEE
jgi:hypothetical protein